MRNGNLSRITFNRWDRAHPGGGGGGGGEKFPCLPIIPEREGKREQLFQDRNASILGFLCRRGQDFALSARENKKKNPRRRHVISEKKKKKTGKKLGPRVLNQAASLLRAGGIFLNVFCDPQFRGFTGW